MLNPITIQYAEFIPFVECTICGTRFSESMKHAWPLCTKGIPHKKMSFQEQAVEARKEKP